MRPKHPKKEIEYALSIGWRFKPAGNSSHAWGKLLCRLADPSGCSISIWSTPRDVNNQCPANKKKSKELSTH